VLQLLTCGEQTKRTENRLKAAGFILGRLHLGMVADIKSER